MSKEFSWGVLTGDVIGSRMADPERWLTSLRQALAAWGVEPRDWELYRGDQFTCAVPATSALQAAASIQATVLAEAGVLVRIGVGIGSLTYQSNRATESQGTAFERSGEAFDSLKRSPLKMLTSNPEMNAEWGVILGFASRVLEGWTESAAAAVAVALHHPDASQGEWAERLGKSQSTVSEALKRASFDELSAMLRHFSAQIAKQ